MDLMNSTVPLIIKLIIIFKESRNSSSVGD
jgi:hypothetical protein